VSGGRFLVKICGLLEPAHARVAIEAGADLVGVVLVPGSPRYATPERARAVRDAASGRATTVAVVADADAATLALAAGFDRVQFHGGESCDALAASPRPTIRAFPFTPAALAAWEACPHAAWLLADAPVAGGGAAFDHAALAAVRATARKPLLLAGGLDETNVAAAIRLVRPDGVDVSSGVEIRRGEKCPERIRRFVAAARAAAG